MGNSALVLVALGAVVGVVWWLSRPVAGGTKINQVAGIRG